MNAHDIPRMISERNQARASTREVAKYPADQKQSAVMACLADRAAGAGLCQRRERKAAWPTTSAWRRSRCTRSRPSTTCTTSSRWASTSSMSAPTCRASCAMAARRWSTWQHKLGIEDGRHHGRRPVHAAAERMPGRLRRCAGDAGQRPPMCSFMSNDKLDQLHRRLCVRRRAPSAAKVMTAHARSLAVSRPRACRPAFTAGTSARRSMPA